MSKNKTFGVLQALLIGKLFGKLNYFYLFTFCELFDVLKTVMINYFFFNFT